jgi:hypothetical protein
LHNDLAVELEKKLKEVRIKKEVVENGVNDDKLGEFYTEDIRLSLEQFESDVYTILC